MHPSPRHSIFPAIEGPDARFQCGSGVVKCPDERTFPLLGQEQVIGGFFKQTFMVSLPRTQSVRIGRTTGLLDEGGVANQVRNVFLFSFAHAFSPLGVGERRSVMGWNPYRPAGAKGPGKFVTHCCSLSTGTVGCDGPPLSGDSARPAGIRHGVVNVPGAPTTAHPEISFYAGMGQAAAPSIRWNREAGFTPFNVISFCGFLIVFSFLLRLAV